MSSSEALRVFFGVLASIISIPAVVLLVKAGMFFGSLARSVTSLEAAATAFGTRVDAHLEQVTETVADHEVRIRLAEQFMDARMIELGWSPDRRLLDRRKAGAE